MMSYFSIFFITLNNLQPLWSTTRKINGIIYQGNLNKGKNKIPH